MKRSAIAAVLIAALPALSAEQLDAGTLPPAVYAERAQLLIPDGGFWVEFDTPGAWLPLPRLLAEGRELAQLRAENARLLEHVPLFSPSTLVMLGVLASLTTFAGVYFGWKLRGWLSL